jgi:hypothetical protein
MEGHEHLLTYLQFRIELYYKLLGYSIRVKIRRLQVGLGGKRVFAPDAPYLYYWEKRPKATCIWYTYKLRYQKALGKAVDKKVQAKRLYGRCVFCKVNLYKEGEYWP